jgi:MipA family protein
VPQHPLSRQARARNLVAFAFVVACGGFMEMAFGQAPSDTSGGDAATSAWGLGLAGNSTQRPYVGVDRETKAFPVISYQSRWFRLAGATAEVRLGDFALTPSQEVSSGLKLKYEDSGYDAGDSPYLSGMADRKSSLWGGLGVEWKTPIAKVSIDWLGDVSGNSKGRKLQVQVDRRFQWERLGLTPRVQANRLDAKYVDYYFGVRDAEVRAGRPRFHGASATTVEAGARLDYQLSRHHTMFMDLSTMSLPDEIKSSPLVGRSSTSRATVGYLYRF